MLICQNGIYFKKRIFSYDQSFLAQTRGLCGDFDGNTSNDFNLVNSTLTSDVNQFGKNWRVGSCVHTDPPPPFVCSDASRTKW